MWKKWFPKYKVPVKIDKLVRSGELVDRTHGEDVTPHFETDVSSGTVVLWVDHPDPGRRYFPRVRDISWIFTRRENSRER